MTGAKNLRLPPGRKASGPYCGKWIFVFLSLLLLLLGEERAPTSALVSEVTITKSVTSAEFECVDDLDNLDPLDNVSKKYTVSLLGFIEKTTPGAACPTDPTNIQNNLVYTAEGQDNCYCVYAAVTSEDITPVILKDLKAESTAGGILVSWQTTTEINNLGFNLYRAKSLYGSRVQLNDQPINGELANPGNPFGGHYEYLDKTGDVGMTYYYWLEDIPADSSYVPELFGPVSAVR